MTDQSTNGDFSKFDNMQFNKNFEKYKQQIIDKNKYSEQQKLQQLSNLDKTPRINLYNQSLGDILFNIKNSWFELLDDVLSNSDLFEFVKNDKLFYLGISLVFIGLTLYMMNNIYKK